MRNDKPSLQLPRTTPERLQKTRKLTPRPAVGNKVANFEVLEVFDAQVRKDIRLRVRCMNCGHEQEVGWISWTRYYNGYGTGRCSFCPETIAIATKNRQGVIEERFKPPRYDMDLVNQLMLLWKPPGYKGAS